MSIERRQFTGWDQWNNMECYSPEYLEYRRIDAVGNPIITYGYWDTELKRWRKLADISCTENGQEITKP